MMKKDRRINGITLISLVITIVIMLILAVVSINLILGNNGIFNKSKVASSQMKYSNAEEKVANAVAASYNANGLDDTELKDNINKIDGLKDKIDTINYDLEITVDGFKFKISSVGAVTGFGEDNSLPENTLDNPQDVGKEVALKDGWGTDTVKYLNTINGVEVTNVEKVATVYAVSVGDANTVPIPKTFYYVGGNLDTGVIISDDSDDKYDGKVDKTTYEYSKNLEGNQFVWIPCDANSYNKIDFSSQNGNWSNSTPQSEVGYIEKYNGFYIARYEAGLASSINEIKTTRTTISEYNTNGIPQSKADVIPWNFINWTYSNENSKNMYKNNNYVCSGLVTGTQWDITLNKIVEKTDVTMDDLKNPNQWGNYSNTSLDYNGRISKAYCSGSWYIPAFSEKQTGKTTDSGNNYSAGDLLTTGACPVTEKYHIFDIAGNLWEWTEEVALYTTTGQHHVIRGGSFMDGCTGFPVCTRNGDVDIDYSNLHVGFRVVLYMK